MLVDCIKIKMKARELGADLCGIAPVSSFTDEPEGMRPQDIYRNCKSVVVFARRMLPEFLVSESCVPYTKACDILANHVDSIGYQLCEELETMGIKAVAVPSDVPYEYWDEENQHGRGVLSMTHAGYFAGLGFIGRNRLLTNKKLGNIIHIGAVLADTELESDKPVEYSLCTDGCRKCIDACPASAIDGAKVNRKLCRAFSICSVKEGIVLKKCYECRKACPYYAGMTKCL
jgi:epoxyqueuosine reductase